MPNTQHTRPPPQFPTDNNNYGIGVALGSPGLATASSQDSNRIPRTMTTITSPANAATEQQQQAKSTGLSRSLSKRLPFLGRSKSRRINSNNGGANNYSRPSTDVGTANYTSGASVPPAPSLAGYNTSRANQSCIRPEGTKLKKHKPGAVRSVTDPRMQSPKGGVQQPPAWVPGQPSPVLDVEIPDIKLERYSVMFGKLFEKQQSTGSLLARRQATLARIRALEDEVRREHYDGLQRSRRSTSPSMTPVRSQAAELPAGSAPDINVVPLRLRSNTFPMIAKEAEALTPKEPPPEDQMDSPGTSMLSPASQLSPFRDSQGRPFLHSKFHKPSVESIRSPYFRQAAERETATALSPPPPGPVRRLPESSNSSSNVATASYSTMPGPAKQVDIPSRSTSLHNRGRAGLPAAPKPKPNPKPANKEEALEDAAEVSIARQISISRQQRRFLEPLHERERRRARANKHIKAASQISMDDGSKRIAETKTATPTFIHPGGGDQQGGGQNESPRHHMYRRSEQVTIEGA
ncbi:hypothetical protein LEL_00957 [Akanthomyces lecanii RCEF 1005]|uniref:Uncharacterized protein n=1 Tax=Akanthomyces lecanii RCEF 1005 TaxID=1081108 RepID=A0A162KEJ6_CORDF|nr:hypothetical protein LEL_00957 [Akanthomyces lecanii RCEF 1005]